MLDTILAKPWPFWLSGAAIGAFVPAFAWLSGKALGISSGYAELCAVGQPAGSERWKLWFLLGLPLGGLASMALAGELHAQTAPPTHFLALALGGAMVGYGARVAGGCTSGHSIVGIAIGAKASILATLAFMVGGFGLTWALVLARGGAR